MEQLIARIVKMPRGAAVAVLAAAIVSLSAINYFLVAIPTFGAPVADVERRIETVAREQKKLDGDYSEKQAIANNLNQFRREKELLDQSLHEALAELPDDKRIDELLQLLQDRAIKAGVEIVTIEPQPQVSEGFYARIPIPMAVQGTYHEIATFLDAVGRLQRIVNVNNLSFDQPKDQAGRVVLTAKFLATTFMFVAPHDATPPKAGAATR